MEHGFGNNIGRLKIFLDFHLLKQVAAVFYLEGEKHWTILEDEV